MVPSGPTVGDPVTGPPTSTVHASAGRDLGSGPPRRPVWRASPPYMANGAEPGAGADIAFAPCFARCTCAGVLGSTHVPCSQTRRPLHSTSVRQPPSLRVAPAQPASAAAATPATPIRVDPGTFVF